MKRNIKIIQCLICNKEFPSVGLDSHLKHIHKITSKEYKEKYIVVDTSKFNFNCNVCNLKFKTERLLSYHIRMIHELNKKEYVTKYIFNNIPQLCRCGCKKEIKIIEQFPYRRDYISGHNDNGMLGKVHDADSKIKMKDIAIKRGFKKNKISNLELKFKDKLDLLGIQYIHQYSTQYGIVDFYLPEEDIYIEVDGVYWHPEKKENLNFNQFSNLINDIKKNKINNLYRLNENTIHTIKSINDIYKYKNESIKINYKQILVSKEFFSEYKKIKGNKELEKYSYLFVKFCREVVKDYPYPTEEFNFTKIQNKIKSKKQVPLNNEFSNNISNVGVPELKSIFKNYWKSSYKGNKSPYNVFNDNLSLKHLIKNRIGVNRDEYFDFSLRTINNGMSVLRYSISFFKPQVAANIYSYFLKENESPIVIDPCAGFGGRLVGFKSLYPNGTYIGIEPNKETYDYLIELKNKINLPNIELHNITLEEFIKQNENINADLTFTSIPYFDKEIYSGINFDYKDINDWKNKFIVSLMKYPNKVINIPLNLEYLFDDKTYESFYLKNNTSNFNKKDNKKYELILRYLD